MSTQKERAIIFSGNMVNAILNGTKTQTRRPIKPQPKKYEHNGMWGLTWKNKVSGGSDWLDKYCPYGQPGDRLWVRETFAIRKDGRQVMHKAGYEEIIKVLDLPDFNIKWKPSIFMPRWASQITLEIVDMRVERLQEITDSDAEKEGFQASHIPGTFTTAGFNFLQYWQKLYAKKPEYQWEKNIWVWVIEFRNKEIKPNVKS